MVNSSKNLNTLYEETPYQDHRVDYWGDIPRSYNDAINMVSNNFKPNFYLKEGQEVLANLKQILIKWHRKMGISSDKVEKNIEMIDQGTILTGQQPIVFGGNGFIGNKLGCLQFLHDLSKRKNKTLLPIFFIGDYDGLQKELTRIYFPNPISHSAIIIDSDNYLPEESNIAVHQAKLPPQSWLQKNLDKLTENLRGFKKPLKGPKKALFEERWEHLQTIMQSSFNNSATLSEWAIRIWGTLTNQSSNLGIIFLPASHPEIRKIVAPQYSRFILNREKYAETFLETTKKIEEMGYKTSLPHRHNDYAPFSLECEGDFNRITTSIIERGNELYAVGKCPMCNEQKSYAVSTHDDLSKIATIIGPRVDTAQAIFQDLLNIRIRISGPGEIVYYAQAAPSVRSIGFELPIFVKYKRAFYGKNSTEKLGKELDKRKQATLHQRQLFDLLKERMIAIKNNLKDEIQNAEEKMNQFIEDQYKLLLNGKQTNDVQKYLGWQFGRFERQKYGQEVSWAWFDLAIQTGATDYIKTYERMYTQYSTLGGSYFINSSL